MARAKRLPVWWPWPVVGGLLIALLLATGGRDDPEDGDAVGTRAWAWPRASHPVARSAPELERLRRRVASALDPLVARHGDELGVVVLGPADGEVLYEHEADRPFVPASNAKLFSSGVARVVLGPEHRFATRLLLRGPIEDGTLRGDLVVVGAGDPSLSPRVRGGGADDPCPAFAAAVRAAGIRRITGDLMLDDGLFDRIRTHPSWFRSQDRGGHARRYRAEVTALLIHDACVRVTARPGEAPGTPATVTWEPRCDAVTVTSSVTTARKGARAVIDCRRPADGNAIAVRGMVEHGTAGESGLCTVSDPTVVFGSVLAGALSRAGVALEGRTKVAPGAGDTGGLREIARAESDLGRALIEANRSSHNLTADCLLKLVGARRRGEGSFEAGAATVREGLLGAGIDVEGFHLVDGSGLSPENRCTARQVAEWLRYLRALPGGEGFAETLAAGGQGTLRRRFRSRDVRDRVRLKTGTLGGGVRALSGYVVNARWGRLVVSILARGVDPTTRVAIVERLARLDG